MKRLSIITALALSLLAGPALAHFPQDAFDAADIPTSEQPDTTTAILSGLTRQ